MTIATVAVVGAGFAGLRAAHLLARAGVDVTVLEARDRVGGRVWSDTFGPGARFERGAEFILPGNLAVQRTADELGLSLAGMGMSYGVRQYRGGVLVSTEAVRGAALAVSAMLDADRALAGAITAAQLVDRAAAAGGDRGALAALRSRVATTNGAALEDQPAGSLADLDEATRDVESRRVVGGNQLIATSMAARLPTAVRLGHAVERLRPDARSVSVSGRVRGAGGFQLRADACVLAVPMLHARRLLDGVQAADPALDLLARLGQGHAAKLAVPLLAPAGPGAVFDVPGGWWSWTARDHGDTGRSPGPGAAAAVAHCFGGSPQALAALEVASGSSRWAGRLAAVRPELTLDLEQATMTDWSADPWALGAYSYPLAGAWTTGGPAEPDIRARVLGRVVVAGEWTAGAWSGFMEGALRTGERAASDVLGLPDLPDLPDLP